MSTATTIETRGCLIFADGSATAHGEARRRAAAPGETARAAPPASLSVLAFWHIVDYVLEFVEHPRPDTGSPSCEAADLFSASTAARDCLREPHRDDSAAEEEEVFVEMPYHVLPDHAERILVFGSLESCIHTLCATLRGQKEAMFSGERLKPGCHVVFLGNVVARHPLCGSVLDLVLLLKQNNENNVHVCVGKNEMMLMRPAAIKDRLVNAVVFKCSLQLEKRLVVCTNHVDASKGKYLDKLLRAVARQHPQLESRPRKFVASTGTCG